jgi:hypothetical protein
MAYYAELIGDQFVQFTKELPPNTKVLLIEDDLNSPSQIGIIVKPARDERVDHDQYRDRVCRRKESACCVLVAWSWPDTPDETNCRLWEPIGGLQKVEDS